MRTKPQTPPVTMQGVADLAGVSRTAVSAVVNNKHGTIRLTKATRQKIEKVLRETNYRANVVGKALALGRSLVIGVVVPRINMSFIPQTLQAVEDYTERRNYGVLLMTNRQDKNRRKHIVDYMLERKVDGIIYGDWAGIDSNNRKRLRRENVPIAYLFQYPDHPLPRSGYACTNAEQIGYLAIRHLLDLGHRHIAHSDMHKGVQVGIQKATAEVSGRKKVEQWSWSSPNLLEKKIFERWLKSKNRPTALFLNGDELTCQILNQALRKGIRIPKELALVGIDDIPMAAQAVVPLTTVSQPKYEQGWAAAEILFDLIDGKAGKNVIFPPKLIRRQTT